MAENKIILTLGRWLFKYRSFFPLPLIVILFLFLPPGNFGRLNIIFNFAGLAVALVGEACRVITVGFTPEGTSGREGYLRADYLNTTGIYSLVRNPLYTANFLIYTGLLIAYANGVVLVVFNAVILGEYFFIIQAEEKYLREKYGPPYLDYCKRVPRCLLRPKLFIKAEGKFRGKKVIFKENDSAFNLLVMYLVILVYKNNVNLPISRWHISGKYTIIFSLLLVIYALIKVLKKGQKGALGL